MQKVFLRRNLNTHGIIAPIIAGKQLSESLNLLGIDDAGVEPSIRVSTRKQLRNSLNLLAIEGWRAETCVGVSAQVVRIKDRGVEIGVRINL